MLLFLVALEKSNHKAFHLQNSLKSRVISLLCTEAHIQSIRISCLGFILLKVLSLALRQCLQQGREGGKINISQGRFLVNCSWNPHEVCFNADLRIRGKSTPPLCWIVQIRCLFTFQKGHLAQRGRT